ncbi:hypothetical protein B0920_16300 [Massilia sp. KIM]|nr:hypothetical protein B0920_16300 [Massilia sp. KIM]
MLLDSSVFKLIEQLGYLDAVGVDDHEGVKVILLRAVCYLTSCPPLASNAVTLSHLSESMEHCHICFVHLSTCLAAGVVIQGLKAQVVESGFFSSLEEPKDSLYSLPVGSLSVTVPTTVVISINDGRWIVD